MFVLHFGYHFCISFFLLLLICTMRAFRQSYTQNTHWILIFIMISWPDQQNWFAKVLFWSFFPQSLRTRLMLLLYLALLSFIHLIRKHSFNCAFICVHLFLILCANVVWCISSDFNQINEIINFHSKHTQKIYFSNCNLKSHCPVNFRLFFTFALLSPLLSFFSVVLISFTKIAINQKGLEMKKKSHFSDWNCVFGWATIFYCFKENCNL